MASQTAEAEQAMSWAVKSEEQERNPKKGIKMYSVQRLEKGTQLERTEIDGNLIKAVGKQTASCVFAVIDATSNVVKRGRQFEIYTRKATAQQVADWYNDGARKEKSCTPK